MSIKDPEKNRLRHKLYREKYGEEINRRKRERYNTPEGRAKCALRNKIYRDNNLEKAKLRENTYKKNNRDKVNTYRDNKYKNDPNFRIAQVIRVRMRKAIKNKSASSMELMGADIETIKKHLESLFKKGMNWDNHGEKGWHIDHILPCASFDLTDPEQQKQCFHYKNLQPLWAKDNLSKSDKILTNHILK
jgi:hypothetical protein